MTTARPWPAWVLAAILATVVANNAFDFSVLVPQQGLRYEMHDAIVNGPAPLSLRLHVVPFAIEPVIRALSTSMPRDLAFRRAYLAFHFLALIGVLASVYAYARLWFSRDQALIGALMIGSVLHLVLRQGEYWNFAPIPASTVFAPWSLLDPVFVALALIFLNRRRWAWLALTILLAAANDGLAMLLLAITTSVSAYSADNFSQLPSAIVNLGLFLGPTTLLAISGWRRAPHFARRAAAVLTGIAVVVLALGFWRDVRMMAFLYPAVTPMILSSIFSVAALPPQSGQRPAGYRPQ